jgi:hypothetical protein
MKRHSETKPNSGFSCQYSGNFKTRFRKPSGNKIISFVSFYLIVSFCRMNSFLTIVGNFERNWPMCSLGGSDSESKYSTSVSLHTYTAILIYTAYTAICVRSICVSFIRIVSTLSFQSSPMSERQAYFENFEYV